MWVLLGLSIVSVATIINRFIIMGMSKTNTTDFVGKVHSLSFENRMKDAVGLCDEHRGPVASIFKIGILRHTQNQSREEIEKVLENTAIKEISKLEKGLPLLATISNVAPMIGFLGTVIGMIEAFMRIEEVGGEVNVSALAGGIWEALLTTAFGLVVAIPALFAYHFFETKVDRYAGLIRDTGERLVALRRINGT